MIQRCAPMVTHQGLLVVTSPSAPVNVGQVHLRGGSRSASDHCCVCPDNPDTSSFILPLTAHNFHCLPLLHATLCTQFTGLAWNDHDITTPERFRLPASTKESSEPAAPGLRLEILIALILAVALVACLAWGITTRSDLSSARDRATTLQTELDDVRASANATVFALNPPADQESSAIGTVYMDLTGAGAIVLSHLDPAPEGRSYQVWFKPTANGEAIPGQIVTLDDAGNAVLLIPADVGVIATISVTLEPLAGSPSPTGPVILEGATGGARG